VSRCRILGKCFEYSVDFKEHGPGWEVTTQWEGWSTCMALTRNWLLSSSRWSFTGMTFVSVCKYATRVLDNFEFLDGCVTGVGSPDLTTKVHQWTYQHFKGSKESFLVLTPVGAIQGLQDLNPVGDSGGDVRDMVKLGVKINTQNLEKFLERNQRIFVVNLRMGIFLMRVKSEEDYARLVRSNSKIFGLI
jgi:hypothetical protein